MAHAGSQKKYFSPMKVNIKGKLVYSTQRHICVPPSLLSLIAYQWSPSTCRPSERIGRDRSMYRGQNQCLKALGPEREDPLILFLYLPWVEGSIPEEEGGVGPTTGVQSLPL